MMHRENKLLVEVFKTSITSKEDASNIERALLIKFPDIKINFDLEDCGRILRIESINTIEPQTIIRTVKNLDHHIEILE